MSGSIPLPWNIADVGDDPKTAATRTQENFERLATVAAAQTRTIWGTVGSTGTADIGSGYSVSRIGVGTYTLTWTTAFSSASYSVVVSCGNTNLAIFAKQSGGTSRTTTTYTVVVVNAATLAAADGNFEFIAIGPA